MNIFEEFQWRGLVHSASDGVQEHLSQGPVTLYIGFDPTARSLHVGSLLQILNLARMQRFGHRPIGIVGGGTGMIGDPSGKTVERQLLTREKVRENLEGIREQLSRFLDFDARENPAMVMDNGDWLTEITLIDFLREIGKHFTVNYMVAKESVKQRMESDVGISFTEFSYLLLQSYDFLELYDRYGCTLQMGASDQWGNITAGTELIRKLRQTKAYGLVSPLVTTSSGVKFGKTEAGAVWLDAELTSPYQFYQFWLGTTDDDVIRYLKYFTWLGQEEIAGLQSALESAPQERAAHYRLARELTRMVHGESALELAEKSSRVLFGGEVGDLSATEVLDIFDDVPSTGLPATRLEGGLSLLDLLVETGLTPSKGQARRLVRDGGAYVNNVRVTDEHATVSSEDFKGGKVLVLRKGRKAYHLVQLGNGE
ncbi:MAG: tyrosine--tRNA ligase [Holophagales bacterium]|nr:tyrosine--tRNA ligase [Holophagales bacterium]